MKIDMKDKDGKQHLWRFIWLMVLLAVLLAPPLTTGLMRVSTLSIYGSGSLILTSKPQAVFPDDWGYCYMDDNEITVSVVIMNENQISSQIFNSIISEFGNAGITLVINSVDWVNETQKSYLDYQLENLAEDYRNAHSSEVVLMFSYLAGLSDAGYGDLGGYARVDKHFACVLVPKVWAHFNAQGVSSIGIHEIAHCLGYWHSESTQDVMYPEYNGNNNHFTGQTIQSLYRLHNEA